MCPYASRSPSSSYRVGTTQPPIKIGGAQTGMANDPGAEPPKVDAGRSSLESTTCLIERARTGDREALERLFARHSAPLRRWASGRLPKWARQLSDTDDLVQDALVQTFKRIEGFEPRGVGALQGYLRQAVLNRLRDELRRRARAPEMADLTAVEIESGESPLELAIGREGVQRYEDALGRLRPDDREAIIGRVELGYTYEELAQVLGKPTADAARKAAQRAVMRLAEELRRAKGRA
jgi:RNA polymerase sigma-70 factor, ECF subfamily